MKALSQRRARLVLALAMSACGGDDQPLDAGSPRDIVGVRLAVAGHNHLTMPDGSLATWGGSIYGALGVPDEVIGELPPPSLTNVGGPVESVAAGNDHTCAVVKGGHVKCWGLNDLGQLGIGDTANRGDDLGEMGEALPFVDLGTDERAAAVTCGGSFTCALLESNAVKCWGNNAQGELGQGDTEVRGDEPGEMGDALAPIDLGTQEQVIEIDAGGRHACVLLEGGAVKCWGNNSPYSYALGRSDTSNIGDEPGQMGAALPEINLGNDLDVITISAGGFHSCAVFADGGLKCWGQGSTTEPCPHEPCVLPPTRYYGGRLGYGDMDHRGKDSEMGENLPLVDLGADARVLAVDAGSLHTCALLDSGDLKCWGAGEYNKLGLDINGDLGDEPGEMGDALPLVDLGTGRLVELFETSLNVSCAVLDDGGVKCWGSTEYSSEMGDALPYIDLPTVPG